jgi:hypothetical protein
MSETCFRSAPRDFVSRGDYGLRDFTQERRRTGSNLLIIMSGFLEGEVHHYPVIIV